MCKEIAKNHIILQLLKNRGIEGEDQIEEFLSSKPQTMYNPFLLHNMEAGVDLLISHINKGSKICIYGDYDADGITATVMMLEILRPVAGNVDYFIPSRFDEGYGLNKDTIARIKDEGYDFILTVDCGSTSFEEIKYAKSIGLDILVTDHHNIEIDQHQEFIINPKQSKCHYPFKDIAGCGVAFKLAQALAEKNVISRQTLIHILDLLAIGTVGDVMPLVDENRTFVKYGLRCINAGKRKGLNALKEKILKNPQDVTSEDLSFAIVPHINAPGRIGDASLAVELLICDQEEKCMDLADQIIKKNTERKELQREAFQKCQEIVSEKFSEDKFLMVKVDGIHEGIAGIVAGNIKEKFNKPTVVLTRSGDALKGSGRSIDKVNIYDVLSVHQEHFQRFGGHAGACGFTIFEETLNVVRKKVQLQMDEMEKKDPDLYEKSDSIDLIIDLEDINLELAKEITLLEPFGNGNPKPLFQINNVNINETKFLGEQGQHVSFFIGKGWNKLRCIMFNYPADKLEIFKNGNVNVVGFLEINKWREQENVQFNVKKVEESHV